MATNVRASRFTQADITRAINGVQAAGLSVEAVAVDKTGKVSVFVGDGEWLCNDELAEWDRKGLL